MHINSSNNSEQKTHNIANDKGVHPSLGLHLLVQLPTDHLYYFLKVIKNVLYNSQTTKLTAPMASERSKTPSWAFSAPCLAKKLKKIGFLEVPPSNLLSLHLKNAPLLAQPNQHAYLSVKTCHQMKTCKPCKL